MSVRILDLLKEQWSRRVALTAEEAATVLMRQPDTIREKMRAGLLPGASRVGGRWQISLPDLAEIIEPTKKAPPIVAPPVLTGARRRRAIVMNFGGDRFWAEVARILGDQETADLLDHRADDTYRQARDQYLEERSVRRRAALAAFVQPDQVLACPLCHKPAHDGPCRQI